MLFKIALLFLLMTVTVFMLVQIAGLMFDGNDAIDRLHSAGGDRDLF